MSDLPAKQSAFSKIRNNILNAGLRNGFTRGIMVNTLPSLFGRYLTDYAFSKGEQGLEGIMELLSSMNERAINSNFSRILEKASSKIENTDELINLIFDTVNSNVAEFVSIRMLSTDNFIDSSITNETSKRIADAIDLQSKSTSEIERMLDLDVFIKGYGSAGKIGANLFQNLTLEQKKEYFSKFIQIDLNSDYSRYTGNLKQLFEQFPEEDRLEQYRKIIDLYRNEEKKDIAKLQNFSECFRLLSENERTSILEEIIEEIKKYDDDSFKGKYLSRIVSAVEVNEQRKYYKEILGYCKYVDEINEFVYGLDKSLHGDIVLDVIEKLREIQNSPNGWRYISDIRNVIKNIDFNVQNNTFIDIINGNPDDPKIKFVLDLLSESEIKENIELFSKENNKPFITLTQLIVLRQKGYNIDNLSTLFVDTECNRLQDEYLNDNLDDKTYLSALERISKWDSGDAHNLAQDYNAEADRIIFEIKSKTYLNLFFNLDTKDKAVVFEDTLKSIFELSKDNDSAIKQQMLPRIQMMYLTLDEKSQVEQFPNLINQISMQYDVTSELLNLLSKLDSNVFDSICLQYTNMFNEGLGTENYQNAKKVLNSDWFVNRLIEKVSNDEKCSFLTEEKMEEILSSNEDFREKDAIDRIFVETRIKKIKNEYDSFDDNIKSQKVDEVLEKLSKIPYCNNYNATFTLARTITNIFESIDNEDKTKHLNALYSALDNIKNEQIRNSVYIDIFNSLDEEDKLQKFPEVLEKVKSDANSSLILIKNFFYSIDENKRNEYFDVLYSNLNNINNENVRKKGYVEIFKELRKEEKSQRFSEFYEFLDGDIVRLISLYNALEDDDKASIFENYIITSPENFKFASVLLEQYSVKQLNEIFKGKLTLDEETIVQLMNLNPNITMKTLLFDKDIDREKLLDLSSYDQLQKGPRNSAPPINIDSIIQNLYVNNHGKSKREFNQLLEDAYNLFTYNNVPEFMKNFRMFQLGIHYNKENPNIKTFQGKTKEERDILILEDLFKISLDSNNESLRNFSNIIIEGKRLTTKLQVNPHEKIKALSSEELALLNQYRDTLFDLHNITKEIRNTDRPKIEKTNDVVKDLKALISVYSDNQAHNTNSKNIVFNPNKIMDELFKGFITTTIRPKAMLEYMDQRKIASEGRHLEIEKKLRDGTMHLEEGDFIKGIQDFDDYIPSMLGDGIKGGEFNQEHSHSDATPLDADFGYISKGNLKKENATDYEIIQTTISREFGENYIVLKQYADRLQDRSRESFDQGTFTGSPDYYEKDSGDEYTENSRYIRTGIPITDVDYIVSKEWNAKNGYEMAMAGIYIPVINPEGKIVFSSKDYEKIREEMRGLSHYNAENLKVSKNARNMDALYEVYRSVSSKSSEEIDEEIETVRGLIEGKEDAVTEQKKRATTKFIKDFFKSQGIKVTDDLSQNLSSKSIELIDTGSTGRGTNVPGDGDFDFMLRHSLQPEVLQRLSGKVQELTPNGKFVVVGDGFRAKDVTLPTGEVVDIDITTAKKSLALSYSSDMCVRDRLNNIKENDPESYNYVQANIIMAKKILKAKGIYKKIGSDGATEYGGFGGIGVENWILQNGGSFKEAIDTFLEAANEAGSYDKFKKKYPIFDFGFNHREGKIRHDCFSNFLGTKNGNEPEYGFNYVKETLAEIQKSLELENQKQEMHNMESPLIRSVSPEGFEEAGNKRSVLRNRFSYSRVRGMMAKFMSVQENDEIQVGEEVESDLEGK